MYINLKPNILMKHFVKIWLHVILKSVVQFYKYRKKKQKTSFVSFSFLDTPKIMEFPIPGSGLTKITKSIAFSRKLIPFEQIWVLPGEPVDSLELPAEEMSNYSIYFLHEKEIDRKNIYFWTRIKRIKHLFKF